MRGYLWIKPAEESWFFEMKDDIITMSKGQGKKVARQWTGLDNITMVPHEEGIILNESNGWQATVTFQFPSTVSNALIKGWQRIYLTVEPHISEGESVIVTHWKNGQGFFFFKSGCMFS